MCPFCHGGFGDMGEGAFWIGTILSVIFWVLVIYFIYWLVRRAGWLEKPEDKAKNNALSILDERFAKGEIDKEEYEERKKELRG